MLGVAPVITMIVGDDDEFVRRVVAVDDVSGVGKMQRSGATHSPPHALHVEYTSGSSMNVIKCTVETIVEVED